MVSVEDARWFYASAAAVGVHFHVGSRRRRPRHLDPVAPLPAREIYKF